MESTYWLIVVASILLKLITADWHDDDYYYNPLDMRPPLPPRPPTIEDFYSLANYSLLPSQQENLTIRPNATRIVGGKLVSVQNHPWQVAVIENNYFVCGGSILTKSWILTAGHCVNFGQPYTIRGGSKYFRRGGQLRRVIKVVRHKGYNRYTFNNDLAMLKLNRPFNLNRRVRTVRLPRLSARLPTSLYVSGWGSVSGSSTNPSKRLRAVQVKALARARCRQLYAKVGIVVNSNMVCARARGKDSCQGDSGGPLVRKSVQYGIVSFGIGCASWNHPGVYTNLRRYRKWIGGVLKKG